MKSLNDHLRSTIPDSLFDPKQPNQKAGWARRLYSTLSDYSHARPGHTDGDMRESNGPIYVPKAFFQAARMHVEVAALIFILVKLCRREFVLSEGGQEVFLPEHPALPEIAREVWKMLQVP